MPIFAHTRCARVAEGAVVATGRFAALIAPASPLSGGIAEAEAKARFGVYPLQRHADEFGYRMLDAAPWFDASADAVFVTSREALTGDALAAAWAADGAAASRRIEAAAEAARLRFLTPGAGKAMTYRAKLSEWTRYQADGVRDPADYPFAAAEAAVRSLSLSEVMALWQGNIEAWAGVVGPAIEALEQGGKLAVAAAVAARDRTALAAAEVIAWPAPS
ncbi:hypothetical protein [Thalassobaculum sp.]|uniref:hypothetical protein n=1 Tax=Thalassobaculum sp. TaxID=2022740 RepID=UPI0032EE7139